MKIIKIKVSNYRLLKNFSLDLEDDLSLVIGKNNCGKTSLLSVMSKFLGDKMSRKDFSCNDFNTEFQRYLKDITTSAVFTPMPRMGISLKLFIRYDGDDDLSNLGKVIMDLDLDNKVVVLCFDYGIAPAKFPEFRSHFESYKLKQIKAIDRMFAERIKETEGDECKLLEAEKELRKTGLFYSFFREYQKDYFNTVRKTLRFDHLTGLEDDETFIDLDDEGIPINKIINFKVIEARREVSNKDNDKTLSALSAKYYQKHVGGEQELPEMEKFRDTLSETDMHLDGVYSGLFSKVIDKVAKFGGMVKGDSVIKVVSSLQQADLLKNNTTVMYDHNQEHSLPEHYNGLGYMNLIGMIFEIEVLLTDFRKDFEEFGRPSDINLLFIEEPEAHTHPQMQYIFIKNIKEILKSATAGDGGKSAAFDLQTIITTHSSHITAESKFNDIKYFLRKGPNTVIAKNLHDLETEYEKEGEQENFKFLRQYLTLNRAELFFADKAVFIEGDTERIILPAMMKKLDQENPSNALLSQNISIIEVGAYAQVFEKFIDFIGIRSLIITDIDSSKIVTSQNAKGELITSYPKCRVEDPAASVTTNSSLKFFFNLNNALSFYTLLPVTGKSVRKRAKNQKWVRNQNGNVLLAFQTREQNLQGVYYHARSFEDAFFHLNKSILVKYADNFKSLTKKHLDSFINGGDVYDFAENAVNSKPSLAMEILLNSELDVSGNLFSNWDIPNYIREGLLWLKEN